MAEDKKSDFGILNKMAMIADGLQETINARSTVIFELPPEEYAKTIINFSDVDQNLKKFRIDISGVDFIFLCLGDDK